MKQKIFLSLLTWFFIPVFCQAGPIANPLGNVDTIGKLLEKIIEVIIAIGMPVVVLMIIYSGFKFVVAQGNASKITEAKEAIKFTIIGAMIVLGAWAISALIKQTVDNIKGSSQLPDGIHQLLAVNDQDNV